MAELNDSRFNNFKKDIRKFENFGSFSVDKIRRIETSDPRLFKRRGEITLFVHFQTEV